MISSLVKSASIEHLKVQKKNKKVIDGNSLLKVKRHDSERSTQEIKLMTKIQRKFKKIKDRKVKESLSNAMSQRDFLTDEKSAFDSYCLGGAAPKSSLDIHVNFRKSSKLI